MKRETGHLHAGSRRRVGTDDVAESQVCRGRSTRRALLLAAASWPVAAWAGTVLAQAKQPILIAWLTVNGPQSGGSALAQMKEGLGALGWKEGSQVVFEGRSAEGQADRLPALVKEPAAKKPAVMVALLTLAAVEAAKWAPGIPIVMTIGSDPVALGLAASLARPGGMVTGVTTLRTDIAAKHLELLLAAAPKVKRVGFLGYSHNAERVRIMEVVRHSAAQYQVDARIAEAGNPGEIEPALSRLAKEGVQGLIVLSGALFQGEESRIVKLALAQRWPIVSAAGVWTEAGSLLGYSADVSANYRRVAYFVDRILKGAKPGDLPIEQPTKFEMVINLKTAKALGITIPQSILVRADRVIE